MALYPAIEPFHQFRMPVSDIHTLYVEQCGNPQGRPVLVLHGGPGGGCSPLMRRFFDPALWHIILFDQRGAGQSTPYGELRQNRLEDLLQDIETLRKHLGIARWMLFGGSWGTTLALHYALRHPGFVEALVLRGIFLARQQDLDWLYGPAGAARLKPEGWETLVAGLDAEERHDPLAACYRRLCGEATAEAKELARRWAHWEAVCATLRPSEDVERGFDDSAWAIARMETHYFAGEGMAGAEPILPRMPALRGVPGIIVHGRYDLVCSPDQAWALHRCWPDSDLRWVEAAGHTIREPDIAEALVAAVRDINLKVPRS